MPNGGVIEHKQTDNGWTTTPKNGWQHKGIVIEQRWMDNKQSNYSVRKNSKQHAQLIQRTGIQTKKLVMEERLPSHLPAGSSFVMRVRGEFLVPSSIRAPLRAVLCLVLLLLRL